MTDSFSLLTRARVQHGFANPRVSFRAQLFNTALRKLIKQRLGQIDDIHQLRQYLGPIDSLLSSATATQVDVQEQHANGVPCRWYKPETCRGDSVLLYLHGGGFCVHLPKVYNGFVSRLSRRLGVQALLPDYRLAPEHPFPAAPQDVLNCYQYLLAQGYSGRQIVIAGDSAGGNLSLGLLMQIRDAGLEPPRCAVLLSPGIQLPQDDNLLARQVVSDPMFCPESIAHFARLYLSKPEQKNDPLAMPIHGDFSGLPPMQYHVGSTEILLGGVLAAAQKADLSGAEVDLNLWDQMPHVHPLFHFLPEAELALQRIERFVGRHLNQSHC
ncbi:alpha/beta hydrolase [Motiliproteus coralliicola]|uniref:Alpha/beta hydrolase n=1 Tax=Motiliproteus coralliicola TaxID=2283196 RepID=A0A369WRT2_9GAMM|nr:alpha/beta hydrolase [Motiliproteus coralliicola]RDE24382.1 alpha/beta hydrolase [Motiliproteus coralliicola]